MIYHSYFGFHQAPFSLTPTTSLFHGLDSHYEAMQTVLTAIDMEEGIIKVTGEVGTGKTLICRMLLNQLKNDTYLIYLPNPVLTGLELKQAVAKELEIPLPSSDESSEPNSTVEPNSIVDAIHEKLVDIHRNGETVVVLIDEAQALTDEAIEVLRLFGNLETENYKLLQIVLLGQPELDERLAQHHLRQFRQRITFSAKLRSLNLEEVVSYIDHRIEKSGGEKDLFSDALKKAIWVSTGGIPRIINQVCHKALLLAFMDQSEKVTNDHVFNALHDTYDAKKPRFKHPTIWGWS